MFQPARGALMDAQETEKRNPTHTLSLRRGQPRSFEDCCQSNPQDTQNVCREIQKRAYLEQEYPWILWI
jgi:hypothetical protein